jgi:hypothetical protein
MAILLQCCGIGPQRISFGTGDVELERPEVLEKPVLCLHKIDVLDRIEGLEELKNLSFFYWFHYRDSAGGDMEFPASLRVLEIEVDVW